MVQATVAALEVVKTVLQERISERICEQSGDIEVEQEGCVLGGRSWK